MNDQRDRTSTSMRLRAVVLALITAACTNSAGRCGLVHDDDGRTAAFDDDPRR